MSPPEDRTDDVIQRTIVNQEELEAALIEAYRLLKEKGMVLRQTANRSRRTGAVDAAARLEEQAGVDERHAEVLRTQLLESEPTSLSNSRVTDDVADAATRTPQG